MEGDSENYAKRWTKQRLTFLREQIPNYELQITLLAKDMQSQLPDVK